MRSFDIARDRRAPRGYRGTTLAGESVSEEFVERTLVVAVKEDCMGCTSVLSSDVDAFGAVSVLVIAASPSSDPLWRSSAHRVLVSPSLLEELDVRWPPFYVLIDPHSERVLGEGVVFDPAQVRAEIAAHLV